MQKIIIFTLSVFLFSYSNAYSEQAYIYIKAKSEKAGNNLNQMELYAVGKNIGIKELKELCLQKKSKFSQNNSVMFSYLVFFDSKISASFPKNPLTAGFNDEKISKHIKAIYTFNRVNGYSKLSFYQKNSWESLVQDIDI
jgi:hypothetical protein